METKLNPYGIFLACLLIAAAASANSGQTKSGQTTGENGVAVVSPARTVDLSETDIRALDRLIVPGDTIEIVVAKREEFYWRGIVDGSGILPQLNLVDTPIRSLCRTEAAIASDLATVYAKFVKNPDVTVRVVDRAGRLPAMAIGAVRLPQRFQLNRMVHLTELIALTGGITDRASGELQIYRSEPMRCQLPSSDTEEAKLVDDAGSAITVIKISDLLAGKVGSNPIMRPGDILTVLEADPVYVTGGVASPQAVGFHEGMTVSRVLAMAGGLTRGAHGSDIKIFRHNPQAGEPGSISVDYGAIRKQKSADVLVRAFDIVDVPTSARRSRGPSFSAADFETLLTAGKQTSSLPLRVVK